MTAALEFLDAVARIAIEALLNSLWQGFLIVASVWLLLQVSRRASATTRHAVWLVGLLAITLLPVFTGIRAWQKGAMVAPPTTPAANLSPVQPATTQTATATTTSLPLIAYQTHVPSFAKPKPMAALPVPQPLAAEPVKVSPAQPLKVAPMPIQIADTKTVSRVGKQWMSGRLPLLLAALWLAGLMTMLVRFAMSYWALWKLRRDLQEVSDGIAVRMERLALVFGIRRRLRVCAATAARMPMTIGWRKPLIILPQDLAETLTPAEYDSVLAHELAHIQRHDYAINFALRFVQCVFFFHPAVWFIAKQLVIERELACDDWAVKLTGEPRRYAGCLTRLVELLSESKPLLAATGILFGKHIITRRVEMILNRDRNATTFVSKPALAYAIALATFCIAICSTISPVIAVPLTQKPQAPAPKPATPRAPKAVIPAPAPAERLSPADIFDLDAPLARIEINGELLDIPSPAVLADLDANMQDLRHELDLLEIPVPPAPAIAQVAPVAPVAPAVPIAEIAEWNAWQQSGEKKAPAIPEDEMLKLLSDIVRRDADANVRAEALSGIYRLRSDAAINTLIQLYDQVTDVKTKGDILARLIRRNGDNSKALAKLVQVVKTEKDETLVSRALGSLGYLKGDEGADQLVSIYDGLSDSKMKQRVIRSMGANKSKKAIEKLMAIAKGDSDPLLRQAALRALSSLDGDSFHLGTGIARDGAFNLDGRLFEGKVLQLDRQHIEEMQRDAQEKMRDAQEHLRDSLERGLIREKRRSDDSKPETTPPPAAGKKPTAAAPTAKPKVATGAIVI